MNIDQVTAEAQKDGKNENDTSSLVILDKDSVDMFTMANSILWRGEGSEDYQGISSQINNFD